MAKTQFDPQQYLPLTPATFHVLLALADRDRHGYAIMQEIGVRTGGQLRLGAGTLYSLLKRLLTEGLIEDLDERPAEGDERRRYYRLTPHGRAVARAEAIRLAAAARLATALRILSPEVAQ